jgi:hypothetical protein
LCLPLLRLEESERPQIKGSRKERDRSQVKGREKGERKREEQGWAWELGCRI